MRALIVALVLALASPALADPPPPAVHAPTVTLKRETLEIIMAEAATAAPARELLLTCQGDVAKLAEVARKKEQGGLWDDVKGPLGAAVVVAAFAAGFLVGH
jgi:hypothetical protein